jgi:alginate O-acetyltransferase complex protein AlgI
MDSADFAAGARRFVLGLAKKQLIADPMAATANSIFAVPASGLTAGLAWLGLIAYTLQIYFDFSSYTDMALGLGRMLGLRLPENFNYPYSSKSIQEFWKRWHMSLSQWLQYYLFLPIAYAVSRRIKGDRFLRVRADYWAYGCGAMVTFLLCGLWHGASWTFIAWGAYHGLFLVVEQAGLGKLLKKHLPPAARWAYAQLLVMVGWVIFRSLTLAAAGAYLGALFGFGEGDSVAYYPGLYINGQVLAALSAGIIGSFPVVPALARARERFMAALRARAGRLPRVLFTIGEAVFDNVLIAVLFLGAVLALIGGTFHPFIYARF